MTDLEGTKQRAGGGRKMSEKKYPTRMHEVLGVETEERFTYGEYGDRKFWLSESGLMYRICDDGTSIPTTQGTLVFFINNPERIIRRPWLSEEQVEKLHAALLLGFKWLTVNSVDELWLFGTKPMRFNLGWGESTVGEARLVLEGNSDLSSLVSWSDPEPLNIVAALKANGVEVEG